MAGGFAVGCVDHAQPQRVSWRGGARGRLPVGAARLGASARRGGTSGSHSGDHAVQPAGLVRETEFQHRKFEYGGAGIPFRENWSRVLATSYQSVTFSLEFFGGPHVTNDTLLSHRVADHGA